MPNRENIIEYRGHLTFSTIGRLLTILKVKMAENGIKLGVYKRILSVMIEALENIYKYSEKYQSNLYIVKNFIPTFRIDRDKNKDHYYIICSNPVRNEDANVLQKKIERINKINAKELKLLYRQTISNGQFTEKGGAGLGLIEMAKISGNPIEYSFEPINDDFSLYNLRVVFS